MRRNPPFCAANLLAEAPQLLGGMGIGPRWCRLTYIDEEVRADRGSTRQRAALFSPTSASAWRKLQFCLAIDQLRKARPNRLRRWCS